MSQKKSECPYPDCDRKSLGTSKDGYCIFHAKTEDKKEREFKEALKRYIKETKARTADYDFSGFVFVGDIHFKRDFKLFVLKNADFRAASFRGDTSFLGIRFLEWAGFMSASFYGRVTFEAATFQGEANFTAVEFHGNASFLLVNFEKRAFVSPKFVKGVISFGYAFLENISLTPLNLDRNAWIDFHNARLRRTEIKREDVEGHIIQEHRKNFLRAKSVYRALRDNFHTIERYDDEGWAFRKEKETERKSYLRARAFVKWLGSTFWNIFWGYGEQPHKLVISAGMVIVSYAFLFMNFGIIEASGSTKLRHAIFKEIWVGIKDLDLFTRLKSLPWGHFVDCLYFSTVTFTTLGYGDFRPLDRLSRLIAATEAVIGAIMMALFVYTFVYVLTRRMRQR